MALPKRPRRIGPQSPSDDGKDFQARVLDVMRFWQGTGDFLDSVVPRSIPQRGVLPDPAVTELPSTPYDGQEVDWWTSGIVGTGGLVRYVYRNDAWYPMGGDHAGRLEHYVVGTAPAGWLVANGQQVTTTYPVLRGTLVAASSPHGSSGGNPLLPNLVDRVPVGSGSTYAIGATGGSATQTLTEANLPSHRHTISDSGTHTHQTTSGNNLTTGPSQVVSGSGGLFPWVYSNTGSPTTGSGGNHSHGGFTGYIGSGTGHNNMQPDSANLPMIRAY